MEKKSEQQELAKIRLCKEDRYPNFSKPEEASYKLFHASKSLRRKESPVELAGNLIDCINKCAIKASNVIVRIIQPNDSESRSNFEPTNLTEQIWRNNLPKVNIVSKTQEKWSQDGNFNNPLDEWFGGAGRRLAAA